MPSGLDALLFKLMQYGEGHGGLTLYSQRSQGALMVSWHCLLWPVAVKPPVCFFIGVCVWLLTWHHSGAWTWCDLYMYDSHPDQSDEYLETTAWLWSSVSGDRQKQFLEFIINITNYITTLCRPQMNLTIRSQTTAWFLPHKHLRLKGNADCKPCFLSSWMLQGFSKAAIVLLEWYFPLRCVSNHISATLQTSGVGYFRKSYLRREFVIAFLSHIYTHTRFCGIN